jgi:hypothetical protein
MAKPMRARADLEMEGATGFSDIMASSVERGLGVVGEEARGVRGSRVLRFG